MRALELYAGIGGFAAAARYRAEIVCAIEQSNVALSVYEENFPHPTLEKNIAGLSLDDFASFDADLWWLSPPCQPFTKRGLRGDVDDLRTKSFLRVCGAIADVRPRAVAMENVPGFEFSAAHAALVEALRGYRIVERVLCPTELGIPNRRARYYLAAAREPERVRDFELEVKVRPLASFLDFMRTREREPLKVSPDKLARYRDAMSILDPAKDPSAIASCFTSAYGRSPAKSGSFLVEGEGARRFSPRELLRLFGFPDDFVLPELKPERAYALIGNSLNVYAVRAVLSALYL